MADERLLSILQVSDLHFGTLLTSGDAELPRLLRRVPGLESRLGHHRRAVADLHRFVTERRHRGENDLLVVSGDVTANGTVPQFDLVRSFSGGPPGASGFGMSLNVPNWPGTAVSGNHDQWPGSNWIVGGPTSGLAQTFPRPFPFTWVVPDAAGITLRFIMVDSDAEVAPRGVDRLLARGRFAAQLERLGSTLPDVEAGEIRVLVVHHSVTYGVPGSRGSGLPFPRRNIASRPRPLEIEPRSLRALEHAVVDHSIRVLMTGHLHVPRFSLLTASNDSATAQVLESRCGTTTQRDVYPYGLLVRTVDLLKPLALDGGLPPNTLMLHELRREAGGRLVWRAQRFWRAPGRGFIAGTGSVAPALQNPDVIDFVL